ncbi:MFS transporter [Agromyces intestinalis]|uniref:MFS transporter n=1 Tax=Agromyces intestinalis TaxID=2592652 RepID=A0A5C1YH08_9MICO|nr:MFS transporter [Agromyces intestinalis]QEO14898.1 MFS transporter [Agromyces intestinalis]
MHRTSQPTSRRAGERDAVRTHGPSRLPWPSLLVLGAAAFVMVTAEMLPTAVLPWMSAGLGVTEPQIGLLVSIWAGVVVVGCLPLAHLTRRFDRRAVIVWSLVALAGSTAATALVHTYPDVIAARLIGALAVGLLWATSNAHTADLVADRDLGRAVSVVLGGATLGTVLGTPVGAVVADAIGWRAAFGGLAVAALIAAVLVRFVVRRTPRVADVAERAAANGSVAVGGDTDASERGVPSAADAGRGIRPIVVVISLVAVLLVGHYGAYTFVTRLVDVPGVPGGIGAMLFAFGVASAIGVFVAGRFADTRRALVGATFVTAAAIAALVFVGASPGFAVGVVLLWGVASGAVPPLAQTLVLRLAGPSRRDLAGALIPVVFNLGIAIGAALSSAVVNGFGIGTLPVLAAGVVVLSGAALAASGWSARSSGARSAVSGSEQTATGAQG